MYVYMYINIYSYKLWFIIMANNVFFLQNLKNINNLCILIYAIILN